MSMKIQKKIIGDVPYAGIILTLLVIAYFLSGCGTGADGTNGKDGAPGRDVPTASPTPSPSGDVCDKVDTSDSDGKLIKSYCKLGKDT